MENSEAFWTIAAVVVPAALLAAVVNDCRTRRIPNRLTVALALTGLLANSLYGGWQGLGLSLAGLAVGLLLLIVPWLLHVIGTGDVKLLAGVGAWLGPKLVMGSLLCGAVIGGVIAGMMIAARKKTTVPYAIALMSGTIIVMAGRFLGWELLR